jgi:hypothetical protein
VIVGGGLEPDPIEIPGPDGRTSLRYRGQPAPDNTPAAPLAMLQILMREAEAALAQGLAGAGEARVIVDGPLTYFATSSHPIIGYVKRLHRAYLPAAQGALLPTLRVGSRTPMFLIRKPGDPGRYSWYLRLAPVPPVAHGLAGVIRAEISGAVGLGAAREAADLTAAHLPALASRPERDPRAPQNLVPVGALEHDLRHRLGDPAWIRRCLTSHLARLAKDA